MGEYIPEIKENMRGLVFCHGNKHKLIPEDFRVSYVTWYTVDQSSTSEPDILANVLSESFIQTLSKRKVDVILTMFCPILPEGECLDYEFSKGRICNFEQYVNSANKILNKDGILYFNTAIKILDTNKIDDHYTELSRITLENGYSSWGYVENHENMIAFIK